MLRYSRYSRSKISPARGRVDGGVEMAESKIYARTAVGEAELKQANGRLAGDEKRLLMLIDGISSLDAIGKKIPPSVARQLEGLARSLLSADYITEVGKVEIRAPLKHPSRISNEKIQEAMMTSQKLNKNMLILAEIEIERRMELEQDLVASEEKLRQTLNELAEVTSKYNTLKDQVTLYKQGMEAKMAAQQAQLVALSNASQASKIEKEHLRATLEQINNDFQQAQAGMDEKLASLDDTVQIRVIQQLNAETEKRRHAKELADEMVQTHPHFAEIRQLEFFEKFRNSDLAQLLVWAEWMEVKAGAAVIEEGQSDMVFYIVISGKLNVIKGKRTINILRAGEPFGEMAFLTDDQPVRIASIVARTDCTLLRMDPAYLDDAELMLRVLMAESFMRVEAKRLRTSVEMVGNLLTEGA